MNWLSKKLVTQSQRTPKSVLQPSKKSVCKGRLFVFLVDELMASSTKQQEPSGVQVRVIGLVPMMDVELGLATGFGVGLSTELAGIIAES